MTRVFLCDDCGRVPDAPMMDNWGTFARLDELLCFHCVEKRLGRQIRLDDLRRCPANSATIIMVSRAQRS